MLELTREVRDGLLNEVDQVMNDLESCARAADQGDIFDPWPPTRHVEATDRALVNLTSYAIDAGLIHEAKALRDARRKGLEFCVGLEDGEPTVNGIVASALEAIERSLLEVRVGDLVTKDRSIESSLLEGIEFGRTISERVADLEARFPSDDDLVESLTRDVDLFQEFADLAFYGIAGAAGAIGSYWSDADDFKSSSLRTAIRYLELILKLRKALDLETDVQPILECITFYNRLLRIDEEGRMHPDILPDGEISDAIFDRARNALRAIFDQHAIQVSVRNMRGTMEMATELAVRGGVTDALVHVVAERMNDLDKEVLDALFRLTELGSVPATNATIATEMPGTLTADNLKSRTGPLFRHGMLDKGNDGKGFCFSDFGYRVHTLVRTGVDPKERPGVVTD